MLARRTSSSIAAFLILAIPVVAHAAMEGNGFGRTDEEAKQRAAADLAAAIQVQVKSVVERCQKVSKRDVEDCGSRVSNLTATDLPMLGLVYKPQPATETTSTDRFGAKVEFSAQSLPLYRLQLDRLRKNFTDGAATLTKIADQKQRYALLTTQLATLRSYQDHRLVAAALGDNAPELPANESALQSEREKLEEIADSIPFAARLLVRDLVGTVARFEPFLMKQSREVTPFGAALTDALRSEMTGRGGPAMRIAGQYQVLSNGDVDLLLEIRDDASGQIAGVRSARLTKAGYAGLRAEPLAKDFEKLLASGEAVSDALRVDIMTSQGGNHSGLAFKQGDSIKLIARANRAAYFYVVGHVTRDKEQFSYLLPVNEGGDALSRFVRRIPADQANHYVEIGEFTVEPPFGTDHLQIVASTQAFQHNELPPFTEDRATGYFMLNSGKSSAAAGLKGTRGIKPKETKQRFVSESTLTFTSLPGK